MRTYENILIVHPDKVGDEYAAVVGKFQGVLNELGATILKQEEWGVRKLAYPVKKQGRGSYVLTVFEGEPGIVAEFERRMRIDESIIKFQTVLLENGLQAPAPAASVEMTDEDEEEADAEEAE
ncbi:30S ribosomal protein S6 [Desulfuromonas sp. CSMB_57]|jgi:small subunit ribosomal protein S6|uniref:30S ribosomal protein S6 n=1 Tax=Desulfuromonas sp. CSMB_57 TaxID=2807629 RepID=UPI001CD3CB41|nr:30S ribosomal protein S6 [Desulfuromonas sp. CSMB_57]